MKAENEYYQNILSNEKEIIQFKHDIKNIFINLELYLRENRIDEAHCQILKLIDVKMVTHEKISGCIPIDAILYNKLILFEENHISHTMDIQFPSDVTIDSINVSAILGNLLDNAIEATLRLHDIENRKINIAIKYADEKLIIKMLLFRV